MTPSTEVEPANARQRYVLKAMAFKLHQILEERHLASDKQYLGLGTVWIPTGGVPHDDLRRYERRVIQHAHLSTLTKRKRKRTADRVGVVAATTGTARKKVQCAERGDS